MTKPTKSPPDVEACGRDYRTGAFTDRQLAAKYGVTHGAVQKWAKKHGWQKDLAGAVKAATAAKLAKYEVAKVAGDAVASAVAKQLGSEVVATTEAVLAVAEVNTQVVLRHRRDILAARDEAIALLQELGWQRANMADLERLAELVSAEATSPAAAAERMSAFRRAVGLGGRVGNIHKLAETLAKLVPLERRAFGLDEDNGRGGKGSFEDLLTEIHGDLDP